MRLKEIIRAKKVVSSSGTWHVGVKMPKSIFPFSKTKGLDVSARYRWRCDRFTINDLHFRVLICYRNDLEKYTAYLGQDAGDASLLVARYEFHATHEGWHYHAACSTGAIDAGRTMLPDRLPKKRAHHRHTEYGDMSDDLALYRAYAAYRIPFTAEESLF